MMRFPFLYALGVAAIAGLAACAGGSAPGTLAIQQSDDAMTLGPATSRSTVSAIRPENVALIGKLGTLRMSRIKGASIPSRTTYVSTFFAFYAAEVVGYPQNNRRQSYPTCSFNVPPYAVNGLGTDFSNNLWVPIATNAGVGYTTEYAPHCGAAGLTIPDTDGQPSNVAFDPQGDVYVENITGKGGFGTAGSIDVYAPGGTSLIAVLREPRAAWSIGVALDEASNVYMSWVDRKEIGHVDEFVKGQTKPTALPMSVGFIGSVAFDANQNMIVVDQTEKSFSVFAPPYTGAAIATVPLQGLSVSCELGTNQTRLYCADYQKSAVDTFSYNSTKPGASTYLYSYSIGMPGPVTGLAISPHPPN
jgi:hypothetical protein